jgi:shikimate dehydrogenase
MLRLALVGDPVDHSLSPVMHRAALATAGLEGEYQAIRADAAVLEAVLGDLRAGRLDGVNVTMPLKEAAAAGADRLTPEAACSGSANSLRAREGVIEAHSTDVVAFGSLFERDSGGLLVLGAGGSARAALAAWPGPVASVSARDPSRAAALGSIGPEVLLVPWGRGVPGVMVVNATPVGMRGERLPEGVLMGAHALVDLPYGGTDTWAVAEARRRGLDVVDGIQFLALQAAASFEWWTGVPVDSARLAAAARNA